jgi:hypothetical protein
MALLSPEPTEPPPLKKPAPAKKVPPKRIFIPQSFDRFAPKSFIFRGESQITGQKIRAACHVRIST